MINAVIVENEQLTIEGLKEMIALYCPSIAVLGVAKNVEAAYQLIEKVRPQLIFLDIQLDEGNGFDLLDKFKTLFFKVIFTTAFDKYAIKAFKYSAFDYLLKPIDPDDLLTSINRLREIKETSQQLALQTLKSNKRQLENLLLKTQDSYFIIKVAHIIYCLSEGNYTTFYLKDQRKIMVSKPLKYYVELLEEQQIYRVHQSYLVNMNWVSRYDKSGYICLAEGHKVPIAVRKTAYFLKLLANYTTPS